MLPMLQHVLPASVSPRESQACLRLLKNESLAEGAGLGSRTGLAPHPCCLPAAQTPSPEMRQNLFCAPTGMLPAPSSELPAPSSEHPAPRRQKGGFLSPMLFREVAGAGLQAIAAAWLASGSLQGKPIPAG